ncbi:MAG: hypothetical protein IT385_07955 [Deltaproteobacteria bacterium]|nr:hypothetical protein [Deltaproteobacteria bacterium]
MLARLLRYRLRSLARRLGVGRPLVGVISLVVIGLALGGLVVAGRLVARGDAASPETVYDRVFWLGTLAAVVWGYTSFEAIFRPADRRFVAQLPLSGATRFTDLFIRAVLLHLPLVLPAMAYALGLTAAGAHGLAGYAAANVGALFVAGLPLSIALHLWAGRSLLMPGSELKRMLAGQAVAEEAALLVYAPAVGLLATLGLGIFADFVWRDVFVRGHAGQLAPTLGVTIGLAVVSFIVARRLADRSLHRIVPRFAELDLPMPYNEDGLPKRTPGEGAARWLPPAARPYFMRDLRQLRRRHRLDRILLWVFAIAMLRLVHAGEPLGSPAGTALIALFLAHGVFFVSAFRLHGAELASPSLEMTLPIARRPEMLGRLAATLIHPLWAVAIAAVTVATTGAIVDALVVLGAGLGMVVVVTAVTTLLARADARVGWPWRSAVVALVGLAGGVF